MVKVGFVQGDRIVAISYIRVIAMIMIIVCHFFSFYKNDLAYVFNVGVQVFLIISGFLNSRVEIDNAFGYVKSRWIKILLPYWIYISIIAIIYYFYSPDNITLEMYFKAALCCERIAGLGHLWFIGAIILCYLITPILYIAVRGLYNGVDRIYLNTKKREVFFWLVLFLILNWFINVKPHVLCCYILGYFIGLSSGTVRCDKLLRYVFPFAIITNWLQYLLYKGEPIKFITRGLLNNQLLGLLEKIIRHSAHIFLGILLFSFLFVVLKNMAESPIISRLDKYSFSIYIVHQFYILGPLNIMHIMENTISSIIFVTIVILLSGIVFDFVVQNIKSILFAFYRKNISC